VAMLLNSRSWGEVGHGCVVCIHGVTHSGAVFGGLAERLARRGHGVVSVDLRGHGESPHEPPWTTERHVQDVIDTVTPLGLTGVIWVGHSFGGRVAAAAAVAAEELTDTLVLLDPSLEMQPERALQGAELGRLDWSFETREGAINAVLNSYGTDAASRSMVSKYVDEDLRRGDDGRYRFSFSPSAVVAAWGEMARPSPRIADVPTLVVCVEGTPFGSGFEHRYRARLGSRLSVVRVPNGHNVLWESPEETAGAVEEFLVGGPGGDAAAVDPTPGYVDTGGSLRPLL
jgi:lipase